MLRCRLQVVSNLGVSMKTPKKSCSNVQRREEVSERRQIRHQRSTKGLAMGHITNIDHVQITVPADAVGAAIEFYSYVLGLPEIEKPEELRRNPGAWYQLRDLQVHVSAEAVSLQENGKSKRHVCFMVDDLRSFRAFLEAKGVEIIPDKQPTEGFERLYVR